MKRITIPKKFRLFGQEIKLRYRRFPETEGECVLGQAKAHINRIDLQRPDRSFPRTQVEQVYLHEVMHCILDALGYEKLSCNEKFVNDMAMALHQVLTTAEGILQKTREEVDNGDEIE